jgi:isoleucyl-tRNA synthetase
MALLLELRATVQKSLEAFRAQKKSSLDADVTITAPPATKQLLDAQSPEWLADFLIVSHAHVQAGAELGVTVAEATGNRCERCWKWTAPAPGLCARCTAAVAAKGAA